MILVQSVIFTAKSYKTCHDSFIYSKYKNLKIVNILAAMTDETKGGSLLCSREKMVCIFNDIVLFLQFLFDISKRYVDLIYMWHVYEWA